EAMVMPEHVGAAREQLDVGKAVAFRARVRWRDGDLKLAADTFEPIEAVEARTGDDLRGGVRGGAASLAGLSGKIAAWPPAKNGEARPLKLVLKLAEGREVELAAKGVAPAGAAARAAIKATKGVERVL